MPSRKIKKKNNITLKKGSQMNNVIDLHNYRKTEPNQPFDKLDLFSIFYFNDEYGEMVSDLETEVKYALLLMTYKYLCAARTAGDLIINAKGFSMDSGVREGLKECILSAITASEKVSETTRH